MTAIIGEMPLAVLSVCHWFHSKARNGNVDARSTELLPVGIRTMLLDDPVSVLPEAVATVSGLRSALVRRQHEPIQEKCVGRLLLYMPGLSMADGMAEQATDGAFDVKNCPGWDVWLAFIPKLTDVLGIPVAESGVLFSWVPEVLVPRFSKGVEINAEGCIAWCDEPPWSENPFIDEIVRSVHDSLSRLH